MSGLTLFLLLFPQKINLENLSPIRHTMEWRLLFLHAPNQIFHFIFFLVRRFPSNQIDYERAMMSWWSSSGRRWTRLTRAVLSAMNPWRRSSSDCRSASASCTRFEAFWASSGGNSEARGVTVPFTDSCIVPIAGSEWRLRCSGAKLRGFRVFFSSRKGQTETRRHRLVSKSKQPLRVSFNFYYTETAFSNCDFSANLPKWDWQMRLYIFLIRKNYLLGRWTQINKRSI